MSNGVNQCAACGYLWDDESPHVTCAAVAAPTNTVQRWDVVEESGEEYVWLFPSDGSGVARRVRNDGALVLHADHERVVAELREAHEKALREAVVAALRSNTSVTASLEQGVMVGGLITPQNQRGNHFVADSMPRTLTADDPPPSNESVVLDRLAVAHQRIGAGWYPRGSARGYLWADMNFPVTLIHDSGKQPLDEVAHPRVAANRASIDAIFGTDFRPFPNDPAADDSGKEA